MTRKVLRRSSEYEVRQVFHRKGASWLLIVLFGQPGKESQVKFEATREASGDLRSQIIYPLGEVRGIRTTIWESVPVEMVDGELVACAGGSRFVVARDVDGRMESDPDAILALAEAMRSLRLEQEQVA